MRTAPIARRRHASFPGCYSRPGSWAKGMRGRAIRLPKSGRRVIALLHFARAIRTVPVQRRMQLAPLIAARAACADKPRWTAIFAKAYALVAVENPVLRRAYVK